MPKELVMHVKSKSWVAVSFIASALLLASVQAGAADCEAPTVEASADPHVQALAAAAVAWFESLDPALAERVAYCLGEEEMYSWTNVPGKRSGGIEFREMTRDQQKLAWDLLRLFLSEEGFAKARLITTEITQVARAAPVGSHTLVMFGSPATSGAWGFQLDGHHLALNFLVQASDVILAPAFLGTQPLSVNGQAPLRDEAQLGRELITKLNKAERSLAKQDDTISLDVIVGSGRGQQDRGRNYDVTMFDGIGLPLNQLSKAAADVVQDLIVEYVHTLGSPFANRVQDALDLASNDGFVVYDERGQDIYYRIYLPDRLLIEYNDVDETHVHTVMRLLGANALSDYGQYAARSDRAVTIAAHFANAAHHQLMQPVE
ncbi:MAG: DUF3500 domain-containing protein [Gammaproteobacteria bacterium]|nr:DUF3500 domain-containing protein [Gammaproteobacteria bacterium]